MKQHWEKLCVTIQDSDKELESFIASQAPGSVNKISKFLHNWNKLKSQLNELDVYITPKPLKVEAEFTGEDFTKAWDFWKNYLQAQYGIIMSPYAEQIALEVLEADSGHDPIKAIESIRYSIFKLYKSIYPRPEKKEEPKEQTSSTQFTSSWEG